MTKKTAGRGSVTIGERTYATDTFEFEGITFTLRELSADEADDIWDTSQNPDKSLNNRLNTRFLLAKSMLEPVTTAEQMGTFGGRTFGTILRHFNALNTIDELNPTPPAGLAGPTPPAGGEPSQPS